MPTKLKKEKKQLLISKEKKNKSLYPSKEQIIKYPNILKNEERPINRLTEWRNIYYVNKWSTLTIEEKNNALYQLVRYMGKRDVMLKNDNEYAVNLKTGTLYFNKIAPSIISTLHEIGHLIYGPSEIKACAYSYQLFSYVFPIECSNLQWDGHMLVKKKKRELVRTN